MTPAVVTDQGWALDGFRRRMSNADLEVRDGFRLPTEPWDVEANGWGCAGLVEDSDGIADVVFAAARGAVVAVACADEDLRSLLVDDLRRIGPTAVELVGPDPLAALDPEQRALLEAIAAGASTAAAARGLHVSLRTAERRLAQARRALGVRTTAEAVALVVRSGGA